MAVSSQDWGDRICPECRKVAYVPAGATCNFHDEPVPMRRAAQGRWRTGRKVGRTIYLQFGPSPSDDDPLIGVMDDPELARRACDAVNDALLGLVPAPQDREPTT